MPTSNYMVDLKTEIDFVHGYGTPAASRTWTDVSAYVELESGLNITHGRRDQRSVADANTLSLTLDNKDGRFTAGLASSPYYPNVKLYRPIRVTATTVAADGSVTSTRFTGYVTGWPTEWDGTDAYAYAQISASSRLMRLGLNRAWRSIIEQNVLIDTPAAYYTLGEPEGATFANESSGNGRDPLVQLGSGTAVTFGAATGPGTDGLTAATFAGTKWLRAPYPAGTFNSVPSWDIYFLRASAPTVTEYLGGLAATANSIAIGMDTTGHVLLVSPGVGTMVTSGSSYADNGTHHAAFTVDGGGTATLYVDGVSQGTYAFGSFDNGAGGFHVGGFQGEGSGSSGAVQVGFTGVIAHAAGYRGALSATRVAAHSAAGGTAFAGETTKDRFERYAVLGGIPLVEVAAETSTITTAFVDTTDQQVVDMLRLVEATEAGVMFDDRDGTLRLHGRGHRYAVSALYSLDMAQQMVEADYSPTMDNTVIFNDVSVQNVAGTYSAHVIDTASVADYGVNQVSAETASEDDDEPLNLASWAVYAYKEPRTRVPTLGVDVLAQVGKTPNSAAVLATNVGDKITVTNQPSQAASSSASYFVEGYTETWGPESCRMTFNVSPTYPESTVLILDDATYGALDTYALAL